MSLARPPEDAQSRGLRLAFAGTPDFARAALAAVHAAGHDVVLVLTQPDRPAGRGLKLQASPVKQFAQAHGIAIAQPRGLKQEGKYPADAQAAREQLHAARLDAMVVAAYGLILPQWVLDLPALGCLNIHASLLPRWRGAAPIHRAIEAGDTQTGVTIMQMDAGLDTGDMLLVQRIAIAPGDTTGSLHEKLADLGATLIVQALSVPGLPERTPQPAQGVTYAHKIDKREAQIDWRQDALHIERRARAFNPAPGLQCSLDGEPIKLGRCEIDSGSDSMQAPCGTILSASERGIVVACGQGALRILELQRAGGKRLGAGEFLRGFALEAGRRLDLPELPDGPG